MALMASIIRGAAAVASLCEPFARATQFAGEVLEFRQAVDHREHLLRVIHMQRWLEREVRDHRGIDVNDFPAWVRGHDMTAAALAELTLAPLGFFEDADLVLAARHRHVLRLPFDPDLDGAAEATPGELVHPFLPSARFPLDHGISRGRSGDGSGRQPCLEEAGLVAHSVDIALV